MTFTHPDMLWGLFALLIPVVVHLFNFRRYRKVYFSNVDALTELQAESRRRHTLRQWLVLLCRLMAIALLVLAFARPVLPKADTPILSGRCAVSIYVDNSFSSQAVPSDPSQSAVAKAKQVAQAYAADDLFHLMTADMAGSEMRWLSRDELLQALDAIEPSSASPLMSHAASRQLAFLRRSGARNLYAFIISDFQRSTADVDALSSDSLVQLTLLPLQPSPTGNLFVDTILLDAPAFRPGGTATLEAHIGNSGDAEVEKVAVRLYIDDHERAMTTVDLAARGSATARLTFSIDGAGWHYGRVEISDYPIVFDDRYHFAFVAGREVQMLEVGSPTPALHRLLQADSLVRLHSTPLAGLDLGTLDAYSALFLCATDPLSSGVVQAVAEWVRRGGTLIVSPPAADARPLPEGYANLLAAVAAPPLGSWSRQAVKASSADLNNALYRGVFAAATSDLELPTLQARYHLAASQGAASQSLIALPGADMLVCAPYGEGRTYLFATPLDAAYTDFTAQALFVPTLYNMALFSQRRPEASHLVGDDAPIALADEHEPLADALTDGAAFSVLPDLRTVGGGQQLLLHDPLPHDGIYRLGSELLAFNYRRAESRLDFLAPDEIAAAAPFATLIPPSAQQADHLLLQRRAGRALWRWCLVGALLALLAETLLLIPRRR